MNSDTPITDKAWQETTRHGVQHLRIAAKELERENTRLRAQLALATDAIKREVGLRVAAESNIAYQPRPSNTDNLST